MDSPIQISGRTTFPPTPIIGKAGATSCSGTTLLFKTLRQHPFRVLTRLVRLANVFVVSAVDYAMHVRPAGATQVRPEGLQIARARWLQRGCRRALRVLHVDVEVAGALPLQGLVVCNHLSYVDILAIGALLPATFIAKREVRGWPVFGWFARLAGTLFVHRERRTDVARSTGAIRTALKGGTALVFFPEGTSSDGHSVLPFKSALLEPATCPDHLLSVGFINYSLANGSVEDEVCYWRDMTLVPHLLNLLGKESISARLAFKKIENRSTDRKQLAKELHAAVLDLKRNYQP